MPSVIDEHANAFAKRRSLPAIHNRREPVRRQKGSQPREWIVQMQKRLVDARRSLVYQRQDSVYDRDVRPSGESDERAKLRSSLTSEEDDQFVQQFHSYLKRSQRMELQDQVSSSS